MTSEKDPKELAPVASVRILCRRPASGGARGARRNVAGPLCHARALIISDYCFNLMGKAAAPKVPGRAILGAIPERG